MRGNGPTPRWVIPVPIWVAKLETALERRRSELDRDEGRVCARQTHSIQTGPLVTIRPILAFGLQYWAMVLQTGALGGGFGAWGEWWVLMDDSAF